MQNVHRLGGDGALRFGMNIGQNRDAHRFADVIQYLQPRIDAHATLARQRCPVRLVIRCLEDILRTGCIAGFFHLARNHLRMVCRFKLTWPSYDGQWKVVADCQVGDFNMFHEFYEDTCSRRTDAVSEIIR